MFTPNKKSAVIRGVGGRNGDLGAGGGASCAAAAADA